MAARSSASVKSSRTNWANEEPMFMKNSEVFLDFAVKYISLPVWDNRETAVSCPATKNLADQFIRHDFDGSIPFSWHSHKMAGDNNEN